ncbi:hypothetical protein BJ875DRAFT_444952 [Amylocarpus encephaloides]|uniref:Uncharacterized protein n=1 Tax=Amylocarpus encephaloides TaxID=45428 RepID=A0A9P7YBS6_9HELO|nr:hypothetical protein BJ875DRAFT_444952 [Amylocarpus encephaloides]
MLLIKGPSIIAALSLEAAAPLLAKDLAARTTSYDMIISTPGRFFKKEAEENVVLTPGRFFKKDTENAAPTPGRFFKKNAKENAAQTQGRFFKKDINAVLESTHAFK